MTLEATIVCLDNSEWMRNGDFTPSRSEAQKDAVNLICASKTQSNPESAVSIMSMAGKKPEVLVTLTQELSKILSGAQELKINGKIDFSTTMQIAQLALRHRQNNHQHPRIIAFVGSPLKETKEELIQLAKRLKKNGVAVDIINFGEVTENSDKLEAFINDVNNNDESHLLTVPPGPHILSDIILQSPIVESGSGQFGSEFINADTDPDLAMALKLSLEEEKQRQERERKAREEANGGSTNSGTTTTTTAPTESNMDVNFEDDPELAEALALSMATDKMEVQSSNTNTDSQPPQQQQPTDDTSSEAFKDQDFLNSTLNSLPGVDPNRIKNALENLSKKDEDKDKDNEKK
ncbi:hypothetical protein ACTFIY_003534 [Dictyostelium cf. discoideum]